jgi:hypothetical protein
MYQTTWGQIPDVSNLIQDSTNLVTVPGIFQSMCMFALCLKKSQLTKSATELIYNKEKIRTPKPLSKFYLFTN